MSRPRFDPNPMPLVLWILTAMTLGFGAILITAAILDRPLTRFTIGVAGLYIATDAYVRLWGKGRQCAD